MKAQFVNHYHATGFLPRKRTETRHSSYELVEMDVREVDPDDFREVLAISDPQRECSQVFHYYDGDFWIADAPDPDDLGFGAPHLELIGAWSSKARIRGVVSVGRQIQSKDYTAAEAHRDNKENASAIGRIGLVAALTAGIFPRRFASDLADGRGGPYRLVDGEVTFSPIRSEDALRAGRSDRSECLTRLSEFVEANVRSVGGKLFLRVTEPIIFADESRITWGFGKTLARLPEASFGWARHQESNEDRFRASAKRYSMIDALAVEENFPDALVNGFLPFSVDISDPDVFGASSFESELAKEIGEALTRDASDLARRSTDYIAVWCKLRDSVAHCAPALGDKAAWIRRLGEEGLFQQAAEALGELERLYPERKYPAARMYVGRSISLPDTSGEGVSLGL